MAEQHARAVQQKRRQFTDFTSYEILLALALDMGRDGRPAKTGYRNLADRCGCHYNTVQTHIKRLEDDGWLRVEKEGKYHHYTVLVPADCAPEPSPVETEVCDNRIVTMEQRLSQLENKLSQLLSHIVIANQSSNVTEVKEDKEDKKGAGEIVTSDDDYGRLKAAVSQATRKGITLLDDSDLKSIDALFRAGHTAEQVRRFYGNGRKRLGWWHEHYWKGQKGQFPKIGEILETIGEAVAFEEIPPVGKSNGTGNGNGNVAASDRVWDLVLSHARRGDAAFADAHILAAVRKTNWTEIQRAEPGSFRESQLKKIFLEAYHDQQSTAATP